jgi:hypothetical protein
LSLREWSASSTAPVGHGWLTTKLEKENKAKATIEREIWNLGQLYREIGDKVLCEIEPPDLLAALRRGARGRPSRRVSS